jgi:endonuclease/exonuclease/phosphatase family metal-dependent hydrolase
MHGYEVRELSWEWPRWQGGYRLDHMLVSTQLVVQECRYEHRWREDGLSDHSALIARLVFTATELAKASPGSQQA